MEIDAESSKIGEARRRNRQETEKHGVRRGTSPPKEATVETMLRL